jgi:MFS transporter, DHA2 family, multidrug resistance protein
LIVFGVCLFVWSMWDLGHLSIASGEPDTRLALIIRGFGLGFLFTPINNVIFAALKGPEIAQGSSFINLARQLGGSFGIAVLNTYITNQTRYHRYNLVSYLSSGNSEFLARQHAIAGNLLAHGYSATTAQAAALGQINGSVQAQASVMAFNDGFLLLGLSFVFAAPAILILRPKKGGGPPGGGH